MCIVSRLTNGRSKIAVCHLALVLPLLTQSLIKITSSKPGIKRPIGQVLEPNGSSHSAGRNLNEPFVVGDERWQNMGNISPVSADHQLLSKAVGENPKQLLQNSKPHQKDHKGRGWKKMRLLATAYSKKIIRSDYQIMERMVDECPDIMNSNFYYINGKNILDSIVKRIASFADVNDHKISKGTDDIYPLDLPEPALQWNKITKSLEFELQTLALWLRTTDTSLEVDHKFRVQCFKLLNMLIKHQVVQEGFMKEWINEKATVDVLKRHIFWICSPPIFSGLNLKESLSKSESSKHLGIFLEWIDEGFWRNMELKLLKKRIHEFLKKNSQITEDFRRLIEMFFEAGLHGFDNDKFKTAELFLAMEACLNSVVPSLQPMKIVAQFPLLQEIFKFIIQYEKQPLLKYFKNKVDSEIFFKKFELSQDLSNMRQISWELFFISEMGLVTVDSSHLVPGKFISWEKAKTYTLRREHDENFKKNFGLYLRRDFETWMKMFVNSVTEDVLGKASEFPNIHLYLGLQNNVKYKVIGTKKLASSLESLESKTYEIQNIETECISKIFIEKTYEWADNLQFLIQKLEENDSKILTKIESIKISTDERLKKEILSWLDNSFLSASFLSMRTNYISRAEKFWNEFFRQFEILNNGIKSLIAIESVLSPISKKYRTMLKALKIPEEEPISGNEDTRFKLSNQSDGLNLPSIKFPQINLTTNYML